MEFQVYSTAPDPRLRVSDGWAEHSLLDADDDVDALTVQLGLRPASFSEFGFVPKSDEDLVRRLGSVIRVAEGDLVVLTDAGDVLLRRVGGRVDVAELDYMPSLAELATA